MNPCGYPYAAVAANAGFQLYANAFYNPTQLHQNAITSGSSTETNENNEYGPNEGSSVLSGLPSLSSLSSVQFYPNNQQLASNENDETSTPLDYSASLSLSRLNSN